MMPDPAEKVREILRRRADAYRTLVQSPGWGDCLQEMLAYADRAQEIHIKVIHSLIDSIEVGLGYAN